MNIRRLEPEDRDATMYVLSQAFVYGSRESDEWGLWRDAQEGRAESIGIWDEAGLQATVFVLGYHVHLGPEVVVPMGGIACVACLPAARGRGYAGAGMKYSLEKMREAGQVVSVLFPFRWDYYRRFGWEWVGESRKYSVPTRALCPDPETEHVRPAMQEDHSKIRAIYTQIAHRYRGMLAQLDRDWEQILEDRPKNFTYTYLYERDGQAEGYLAYSGGKEEETHLREFLTLTARAQRALLGLLRRHEMQTEKFTWQAPPDDTLWSQFMDWDMETRLEPKTMGRVVDVVGALQAWRPAEEAAGSVILKIEDDCAPWNARTWQVEFAAQKVSVRPTEDSPQVAMDIQAFSQAYFGTPTVEQLRAAGRLFVHDEGGYEAMRLLLTGPPMWLNDSF